MIFQAALDESGYASSAPDDIFVFAGYIGELKEWEQFTHKWQELFDDNPQLKDTKTFKQLMRWTGSQSDPVAVKVMQAVHDSGLHSIRCRIPYREFYAVPKAIEDGFYRVAWTAALLNTLAPARDISDFTLELFYDENIGEEPKVNEGYSEFWKWVSVHRPEVAKMIPRRPIPRNDASFWPLRAADALAWNTRRAFFKKQKGEWHSNPLWTLLNSGSIWADATWSAAEFREIYE